MLKHLQASRDKNFSSAQKFLLLSVLIFASITAFSQGTNNSAMSIQSAEPLQPSLVQPADKNLPEPAVVSERNSGQGSNTGATLSLLAPPANDDCAGAITLTPGTACSPVAGSSNTATSSGVAGCGGTPNDDVWYTFIATATSHEIVVDGAANMDAVVNLRGPGACNGASLACADLTFGDGIETLIYNSFVIGSRYYIRVYDYASGAAGWGDFTICLREPYANNTCAGGWLNPPYVLNPNTGCVEGSLLGANLDAGEITGACITPAPTRSVWYSFQSTQANMWLAIKPTSSIVCSANFGLSVWQWGGSCPPAGAAAGCKNFQTYNANFVYNKLILSGLAIGGWYLVQVTQNPGCAYVDFCISLGTPTTCTACGNSCGPICVFAGPTAPTVPQVVSTCTPYPLSPPLNQSESATQCYTFTAPNDTVNMQQVVSAYCSPNTFSFTYSLYTSPGCALIQSGNVFANNMITGLTIGQNYQICYSLTAACTWESPIYPYLYTTSNALPVELIAFEASPFKGKIQISWSTASEINSKEFIIERTRNGMDFEEITRVKGAGTTTTLNNYRAFDLKPFNGNNYYRLKQIDFDGSFSFSKLAVAVFESPDVNLSIIPNPANGDFAVRFHSSGNSNATIKITDVRGKVIVNTSLATEEGITLTSVSAAEFSQGIYFVQLAVDNQINIVKLVKE
ncbi:MAG: T9SS type A sorting domain-containing protein [Bacteroidia bacterium]